MESVTITLVYIIFIHTYFFSEELIMYILVTHLKKVSIVF